MAAAAAGRRIEHFDFHIDRVGFTTIEFDRAGASANTLSPGVFGEFQTLLDRCETDPAVRAVMLVSAKLDGFVAGGDIDWLATLDDEQEAYELIRAAQGVLDRLERLHRERGKPVVAAIHGACLGGGLELAMACSQRLASDDPSTVFGQPEVRIGLIPGAGGTQRLPRLVGTERAIQMIVTGKPIGAHRARSLGIVDRVCPPEQLRELAREVALKATRRRTPPRRRSKPAAAVRRLLIEKTAPGRAVVFRTALRRVRAETKGHYPAPEAALDAIRAGVGRGIEAGLEREARLFAGLLQTPEAVALRSIFFATREAKRADAADVVAAQRVAVVGGGLMGSGIAAVTVTKAGLPTVIKEVDQQRIDRAVGHVLEQIERFSKRRRLSGEESDHLTGLVSGTADYEALGDADVVIEAVFEDLDLKRSVLSELENTVGRDAVLATNTSSIPISLVAAGLDRPERVVGMHYFSPVERMPLLEVVIGDRTSPAAATAAARLGRRQGKTVVQVGDGPGFYTTRILAPYGAEALRMVMEGCPVEAVDDAMVAWGFPIGPLALVDEVGIDVASKIAGIMAEAFGDRATPPEAFAALVADGRFGKKAGRGFYRYDGGKRTDADPDVYPLLDAAPRVEADPGKIQRRVSTPMIMEAIRCLEEGVLRSAGDGDVAAVMGLGFPPFRGGPFHLVDTLGPRDFLERTRELARQHGARFDPPALLEQHASTGEPFRT